MNKLTIVLAIVALFSQACKTNKTLPPFKDSYNIVWTSPSRDASGSMPCGGGDIGLNVWVENGDVLFYMQRSGCLAEQNEYLKLGRVRLSWIPIPLPNRQLGFRQELKLQGGICRN